MKHRKATIDLVACNISGDAQIESMPSYCKPNKSHEVTIDLVATRKVKANVIDSLLHKNTHKKTISDLETVAKTVELDELKMLSSHSATNLTSQLCCSGSNQQRETPALIKLKYNPPQPNPRSTMRSVKLVQINDSFNNLTSINIETQDGESLFFPQPTPLIPTSDDT